MLWNLFRSPRTTPSARRGFSRKPFQPTIETLEERLVCSTTPVSNSTAFPYSTAVQIDGYRVLDDIDNGRGRVDPSHLFIHPGQTAFANGSNPPLLYRPFGEAVAVQTYWP